MKYRLLTIILTIVLLGPAIAQEKSGVPQVIDGNTIIIDYQRIFLQGIKAPKAKQTCNLNGKIWLCGWEAANALSNIVGHHWITCISHGLLKDGDISATCFAGNELNLNEWMVRNGWAEAKNPANTTLFNLENKARRERKGIWQQ